MASKSTACAASPEASQFQTLQLSLKHSQRAQGLMLKSTLRGKRCSPVESLFLIACSSSGAAACLEPIRVPLPPLVSAAPNSSVHSAYDDEDACVGEDELTVIAEDDREDDGGLGAAKIRGGEVPEDLRG
ncbi:hypothetical protein K438DRAFT_1988705 [Mycena galopus ATCC 62051]|nr:hypothetical protein K438DRAFT_1988705 [Mycena galopus ATCC 62051]